MALILLSLFCGIVVGILFPPRAGGQKAVQRLTLAGLFILLAAMGAQLGANERVLANLHRMGLQAFLLAFLAVAGSVMAVHLAFRWLESGNSGRSRGGGGQ